MLMNEMARKVMERIDKDKLLLDMLEPERNGEVIRQAKGVLLQDVDHINVESFLKENVKEVGSVLYWMSNWGIDIPEVSFFGDKAKDFYVFLMCGYIEIHLSELYNNSLPKTPCHKSLFTDDEYRILLAALGREREVCEKADGEDHRLRDIMSSIEKKIQDLQYPESQSQKRAVLIKKKQRS